VEISLGEWLRNGTGDQREAVHECAAIHYGLRVYGTCICFDASDVEYSIAHAARTPIFEI
jgi:hypothetical protein